MHEGLTLTHPGCRDGTHGDVMVAGFVQSLQPALEPGGGAAQQG